MDGIEFLKSLPDNSVDGIFTDPPWGDVIKRPAGQRPNKVKIRGRENWEQLIRRMTDEAARVLTPNGRCLIWVGTRHIANLCRAIDALEYRWTVYVQYMPPRYVANFQSYMDCILYYARPGSRWPKKPNGKCIPQLYLKCSTGKSDTVSGSDTVGVGTRALGLKWDSCEIDPKMYETGLERHKQMMLFENP